MSWCTIESDPGVFTEMVSKIGVKDIQFEEIVSLDDDSLKRLGEVVGLIFLFRFRKADYEADDRKPIVTRDSRIYFAKQTVHNACATQAIINILLNSLDRVQVGSVLSDFRSFTMAMPPDMRGDSIGQQESIRKTHNSFARAEPFVMEASKSKSDDDDVFHFIGYTPINGSVYELDGLKEGPIALGNAGDNWIAAARTEIQRRMSKFKPGEVHFNLMAIIKDRRVAARKELAKIEEELKKVSEASSKEEDASGPRMGVEEDIAEKRSRARALKEIIDSEDAKRKRWSRENKRRQHNYVPLIIALLKKLAKEGKLEALRKEGLEFYKTKLKERRDAAAAASASKKE